MAERDPMPRDPAVRFLATPELAAPTAALRAARRLLLDTLAVTSAGVRTETGRRFCAHAADWSPAGPAGGARLPFDGRRVSPVGCAFAAAGATDAFDAHDGHALTKGHVGAAAIPAALAFADELAPCDLDALLRRVLIGYEIGTRAGIALHRIAAEYHTSGAWNALAAAAIGARSLGLDPQAASAALGAAEFYGPRGLMMRVIDRPSMLKDGSAAGAARGVEAALLAQSGFRAGPAELSEHSDAADLWSDLGARWRILEQYVKPYPVCRWAQPAVEAAMALRGRVDPMRIRRVRIASFTEAVRLAGAAPSTSDAAQYAIAFPVAAALRHGRLGAEEIDGAGLRDRRVLDLAQRIELRAEPRFDARFPGERWAEVTLVLDDGTELDSGEVTTRGDPDSPLDDAELSAKAETLAGARGRDLAALLLEGDGATSTRALLELVARA
jgi:2-methylcitrate dehydratase PrpD